MKCKILFLALIMSAALALPAMAQPVAEAPDPVTSLPDAVDVVDVVGDDDSSLDGTIEEIGEGVEEVGTAIEEIKAADGDRMAIIFGIAALIAGLLKAALAVLKRWGGEWFKGDVLKIICAVVGLVAFIAASIAPDVLWYEALILGLSGPGAVLLTEYTKRSKAK